MLALPPSPEAGKRLRAERERAGLSIRDVARLSQQIAEEKKDQAFCVSHNWVSDVENGRFRPRLAKLYSLSLIYQCNINEILALFGLNLRDLVSERGLIALPHTHLVPPIPSERESLETAPLKLPGDLPLNRTNLLHRMVESFGEMPLFLLQQQAGRHDLLYGCMGTEDYTLDPLIRPGSLVQIDPMQTKIVKGMWTSEHDRPVYFFELRDNRYACSWCELEGNRLLLVPSPMSQVQIRYFRYPQDAEVVGRVTGVAMRIAQPQSDDPHEFSSSRSVP